MDVTIGPIPTCNSEPDEPASTDRNCPKKSDPDRLPTQTG